MRRLVGLMVGCVLAAVCVAEDDDAKPTVAATKVVVPVVSAATTASVAGVASAVASPAPAPAAPAVGAAASAAPQGQPPAPGSPARFTSEAKWQKAGYTLDEIVYTIAITSQDSRILRCRTKMQGTYSNNGKRDTISDLQVSTVFPDQQVQVGTWTDMDEAAGATYSVECKTL